MKRAIKIFFVFIVVIILIVGIPIAINECYKANCGYITVWDGADVLGYYGTVLGAAIAVLTLVATILFTKAQIRRESYLRSETEKWAKLKLIFLEILESINPIGTLKKVMDTGFTDPSKAINTLQKYQMNCKTACDQLNTHLNVADYTKFKELIDCIADISEEFINISQEAINQYSDLRLWQHKETALEMLEHEKACPGSFSENDIAFSNEVLEKASTMTYTNFEIKLTHLNSKFISTYESKFQSLLQLNGATFEAVNAETQQHADGFLRLKLK